MYKRQVLERIENPLAAVTEERAAYLQQEKEFYTVLAVSYTHLDVYKRQDICGAKSGDRKGGN